MGHLRYPIHVWTRGFGGSSWVPAIPYRDHWASKIVILQHQHISDIVSFNRWFIHDSFGYLTSNTASSTDEATTHLSNQNYRICVRREKSYCYICWSTWDTDDSFGVSISDIAATARSGIGTDCELDYIEVNEKRFFQRVHLVFRGNLCPCLFRFPKEQLQLLPPLMTYRQQESPDTVDVS